MSIRQKWSQLTIMSHEDDLTDIIFYVLFDESKINFLRKFVGEYKNCIKEDVLQDTTKLIINVSQNSKEVINPNILDVLFKIKGFHIDIYKLKHYKYIVQHGHPKILSDTKLSRHMNIQELYDYFKLHNTEALVILIKTFTASLEERFIQDIPKLKLISDVFNYIKEKSLFDKIDYNALLSPLKKEKHSMPMSVMCFDFDELADPEDNEDFEWIAYANRDSEDYRIRLSIFRRLNVNWNTELVNYLKEHRLYEFLYTKVIGDLETTSPDE